MDHDDFHWPPTSEELDAIEVRQVRDAQPVEPSSSSSMELASRPPDGSRLPDRASAPASSVPALAPTNPRALVEPRSAARAIAAQLLAIHLLMARRRAARLLREAKAWPPEPIDLTRTALTATSLLAIIVALAQQLPEREGIRIMLNPATWVHTLTQARTQAAPENGSQTLPRDASLIADALPAYLPLAVGPGAGAGAGASANLAASHEPQSRRATAPRDDRPVRRRSPRMMRANLTSATTASTDTPASLRRAHAMRTAFRPAQVSPPLRIAESYVEPRLVSARRVRGKVVLDVQVHRNGRVGRVDIVDGKGGRDLEHAAVSAVKQWRYRPALRNGVPMPSRVKVIVNFT